MSDLINRETLAEEIGVEFNKRLSYTEFTSRMREWNSLHYRGDHRRLHGVIVFTKESFNKEYSLAARSYGVSSENKAWIGGMGGYSIYGSSLDGSDPCARLDYLISSERGGRQGWRVAYCYFDNIT